jgi:cytochrome c oxidase assembly factor 6
MGWFSSTPKKGEGAPNREDRKNCWETRDAYFACLDKVGVIKAGEEGKACSKEKQLYEGNCARSWVCSILPLKAHR